MTRFSLTGEMLLKAKTYLPLSEKAKFVQRNAERCFDRLSVAIGDKGEELPPMFMENPALKQRYLMGALVKGYLGLDFQGEDADSELMTEEEYDRYAGSHLLNQIKRMKAASPDLRDRAFDLLADFSDLEKRMGARMHGLLNVQNDAVYRQQIVTQTALAQLPELTRELEAMRGKTPSDSSL